MRKLGLFAFLVAFAASVFASAAAAEPRVALVIGNAAYQSGGLPRLTNPVNDARLMGDTLSSLGFDVVTVTNATEDQMQKAIRQFGQTLKAAGPDAVGLYYFSGHGVQSDGINYMVPIDAQVQTIEDVESVAPRMGLVLRQMELAGNANNFVILDACRNNDLPAQQRGALRGLVPEASRSGRSLLIAYATQPGATAEDGAGSNSPYTETLARLLKSEAVPALNLFSRVGAAVRAATNNRQQPWTENALTRDDFCFQACAAGAAIPPAQIVVAASDSASSARSEADLWDLAKKANSAPVYQEYLVRYPAGQHVAEATAAIAELALPKTASGKLDGGRWEKVSGGCPAWFEYKFTGGRVDVKGPANIFNWAGRTSQPVVSETADAITIQYYGTIRMQGQDQMVWETGGNSCTYRRAR